jgi:hypothetical protein
VQDPAGVHDGFREVRRLRGLVAADVRRGEARTRRVPLAPKHNGKSPIRSRRPNKFFFPRQYS